MDASHQPKDDSIMNTVRIIPLLCELSSQISVSFTNTVFGKQETVV